MIVVMLWYSDGSAKPELRFFPGSATQIDEVCYFLASQIQTGKDLEIRMVEDGVPYLVFPKETSA